MKAGASGKGEGDVNGACNALGRCEALGRELKGAHWHPAVVAAYVVSWARLV